MATTAAYMVEAGEYEDRRVLVISLDQAAAQRYADHHNCQRNRSVFAEVSEIECVSADWAPPTDAPSCVFVLCALRGEHGHPMELFCDNCQAITADECFCAEPVDDGCDNCGGIPVAAAHDDFPCCSTPGGHAPSLATRHCTGCLGAGTGVWCCICGGLR